MSEIPDDVMKVASNIVTDICVKRGQMLGFHATENEYLEQAIARSILAERERCADVAKNWRRKKTGRDLSKASFDPCGRWEGGETYEEGRPQELIASAIRNPKP